NYRDQRAAFQVQHADAAWADVRGIGATPIGREYKHVRLRSTSGNFSHHFFGGWINDVNSLGKFRADVQQSVGTKPGAMWPDRFSQIDDIEVATFAQIDYMNGASVGAGFTYAGISVNRDI